MSTLGQDLAREINQLRADANVRHRTAERRKSQRDLDFTAGQIQAYARVLNVLGRLDQPRRRGDQ